MKSPVLFVIFKREDTTRQVFQRIREAQPPRLYIAADGPRADRPDEIAKCEATRKLVENVDWPCEVHRLYRDKNLGCGKGVSSAITWFFEHEEEGIIIEDDILPHMDFFRYCDEMLERYRNTPQVKCICGSNAFYEDVKYDYSYYFSHYMFVWGWATWRRTWNEYDFTLKSMTRESFINKIKLFPIKKGSKALAIALFDKMTSDDPIDTWDYQLVFSIWNHGGLNIVPISNLCKNIGFATEEAAHTTEHNEHIENHETKSCYPLIHPIAIKESRRLERITFADFFLPQPGFSERFRVFVGSIKAKIIRIIRHS